MSIFNFRKKGNSALQKAVEKVEIFERELKRTNFELHQIQGYIDAQTCEESVSPYGINAYKDYVKAVESINTKYENGANWGNGLCANIIDFRAAVTVSSGPQYKPAMDSTIKQKDEEGTNVGGANEDGANGKAIQSFTQPEKKDDEAIKDNASKEMDFCRSFYQVNDLDHETPQEWGREAEIEGRVSVGLEWDEKQKNVVAKLYPWIKYRYEEVRSKVNPKVVEEIKWAEIRGSDGTATISAGSIAGDNLVCRRFGGRLTSKYPTTKVMRVLTQIDYIDQAFRDWREIDRLYATPIPVFECATVEEADEMNARLEAGLNFKIKKAWALVGKFKFAGPDMAGIDSLEREIMRQSCFIAGTTGYPLQFLLPDMLSNRSTSENIMESALIHTASERAIWTGFYEELIKKAMTMYTAKTQKTPLDPNKIAISISLMTEEQWQRLTSFWLPAFKDDLVTREAVLPQIPDFNVREELDRRAEADKEQVAQISKEIEKARAEADAAAVNPGASGKTVVNNNAPLVAGAKEK